MKRKQWIFSLFITIVLASILSFIKLPYFITKPGIVGNLSDMIQVENGFQEKGSFSLTTIRIARATPATFLCSKMRSDYEILPINTVHGENESDEEYLSRQIYMMEDAQENAIMTAYKKARKKISIRYNGVYVYALMKGMPAYKTLKVGDRIEKVDGITIHNAEQFTNYIQKKKRGDQVSFKINRNGKIINAKIALASFPNEQDKAGVGVSIVTDKKVETSPDITFNTKDIGGPSAGLMMSLEIYNQLTAGDLTKGLDIAGTGTVNENGEVGPIGGIAQKVIAADQAEMDIFFAPNEHGKRNSDYQQALKTADRIHSKMKIVPVDTFDDAVRYLQNLRTSG